MIIVLALLLDYCRVIVDILLGYSSCFGSVVKELLLEAYKQQIWELLEIGVPKDICTHIKIRIYIYIHMHICIYIYTHV